VLFGPVAGGLDILVNNAAINPPTAIRDITPELFDRVMTVNAKFPLLVMQRAEPLLRDGGRIINISSLNTVLPAPGVALYAASKAALEQFTKVAAREFGPRGITVNTVSPGMTDTGLARAPPTRRRNWRRSRRSPHWAAWARPLTSRTSSPSWPVPTPGGSRARISRPAAA
jgi:NAD(P)-dependent dehydrogenase (short-subunit alcohol dehydrogenase family)